MWCAMSEDDDNTNQQEDYVHIDLSGVVFHVHCVGLGCHVVFGVGRLIVRFHHAYAIPSFLLDVAARLFLVIVNSDCSHNYCLLHIAKAGHLRCCLYKLSFPREACKWGVRTNFVREEPLDLRCLTIIRAICVVEDVSMYLETLTLEL